jgi:hypothetical protein
MAVVDDVVRSHCQHYQLPTPAELLGAALPDAWPVWRCAPLPAWSQHYWRLLTALAARHLWHQLGPGASVRPTARRARTPLGATPRARHVCRPARALHCHVDAAGRLPAPHGVAAARRRPGPACRQQHNPRACSTAHSPDLLCDRAARRQPRVLRARQQPRGTAVQPTGCGPCPSLLRGRATAGQPRLLRTREQPRRARVQPAACAPAPLARTHG